MWVVRLCLVLVAVVVAKDAEKAAKVSPSGWLGSNYVVQQDHLTPMMDEGMTKIVLGAAVGGISALVLIAVLISVLCILVLEAKVERERARFLDTRIAQFVDKPNAEDGEGGTADELDDKVKSDGIPKTTTEQLENFEKEKKKYNKGKDKKNPA